MPFGGYAARCIQDAIALFFKHEAQRLEVCPFEEALDVPNPDDDEWDGSVAQKNLLAIEKKSEADEEYGKFFKIREQVISDPACAALFREDVLREVSVFVKHPSGILKCRFDLIDLEDDVITDVKSTQDASMTGFFDQAAKFHYGVQQEFYRMVAEMAWGHKFTFAFLAIEMSEPFDFAIRTMPEICTPVWTAQITDAMQRIAQCIEQDQWPGYTHENAFCPVGLRKNSVPLRH